MARVCQTATRNDTNYTREDMIVEIKNYITNFSNKANLINSLGEYKKKNLANQIFKELNLNVSDFIIEISCNPNLKEKINSFLDSPNNAHLMRGGDKKKSKKKSKKHHKKSKKRKSRKKRR